MVAAAEGSGEVHREKKREKPAPSANVPWFVLWLKKPVD